MSRAFFKDGFEVVINLGDCYQELKEHKNALACFNKALNCEPKNAELQQMIAEVKKSLALLEK